MWVLKSVTILSIVKINNHFWRIGTSCVLARTYCLNSAVGIVALQGRPHRLEIPLLKGTFEEIPACLSDVTHSLVQDCIKGVSILWVYPEHFEKRTMFKNRIISFYIWYIKELFVFPILCNGHHKIWNIFDTASGGKKSIHTRTIDRQTDRPVFS